MRGLIIVILTNFFLLSCERSGKELSLSVFPPIYPDYIDVTIPVNIAPLNFMIRDSVEKIIVDIKGPNGNLSVRGNNNIKISESKWKALLLASIGDSLQVQVKSLNRGDWVKYKPFYWHVKGDSIDSFLSYRLIEPGYEVWNKIQLVERNVESFSERVIADNNLTEGNCMNCHIYGNQSGTLSMFHLRGKNGGTILNRDGKLRKINTKTQGMISNATYGNFHPSGQYAVFSTNVVIPEFHAYRHERLEVYDSASDLIVLDFDKNKIITQPFFSDSAAFESFPVFSACGNWIYFCSAPFVTLPDCIKQLKYNICRVGFDAKKGIIKTQVDTVWNAKSKDGSVSHLKTSPDGKYLLYTVADFGTFPIWHREADLQLMDLYTGKIDSLKNVNGPNSDTYHSWSSNSHWFVFASKRDDGIYGKPYFCYINSTGKASKPFVLPQENPEKYDNMLKSYNIPELSATPTTFDAGEIETIFKEKTTE